MLSAKTPMTPTVFCWSGASCREKKSHYANKIIKVIFNLMDGKTYILFIKNPVISYVNYLSYYVKCCTKIWRFSQTKIFRNKFIVLSYTVSLPIL